ncbi:hypothetical protein EVAR_51182_1 [Eumeta japonica]|uniref:Uncharacterized protein n=1 Tax=Eumeta variegata TaxID=151549 RepID=A0A4C1XD81_EUMVA|nr:hypothetical protein EVAR_51182_1 [Eumeta japonica]
MIARFIKTLLSICSWSTLASVSGLTLESESFTELFPIEEIPYRIQASWVPKSSMRKLQPYRTHRGYN